MNAAPPTPHASLRSTDQLRPHPSDCTLYDKAVNRMADRPDPVDFSCDPRRLPPPPASQPTPLGDDPTPVLSWRSPTWAQEGYIDDGLIVHRRTLGVIDPEYDHELLHVDLTRIDDAAHGPDPVAVTTGPDQVSLNGHLLTLAETQSLRELLGNALKLTGWDPHRQN